MPRKVTKLLRYYTLEELKRELEDADSDEGQIYWHRVIAKWWRHQVYAAFKITVKDPA